MEIVLLKQQNLDVQVSDTRDRERVFFFTFDLRLVDLLCRLLHFINRLTIVANKFSEYKKKLVLYLLVKASILQPSNLYNI